MKKVSIILLIIIMGLTMSSCLKQVFCEEGEGRLENVMLEVDEFTGIELKEDALVFISQGETQSVEVVGHENIIDRLQTEVKGGIWDINLGRDCYLDLDLEVRITVPFLEDIHISGNGNVDVGNFNSGEKLNISISGAGKLEMAHFSNIRDVDVDISGSGEILVKDSFPSLDNLFIDLTGSGHFDGYKMSCNRLDAKISGTGDIYTTVKESIDIRITGAGDLHYKGNPLIDANITGSGKIINEN